MKGAAYEGDVYKRQRTRKGPKKTVSGKKK